MKIGKFFQLAILILLAAGAQPAYSAFYQWSKTAATNATADPTINWAENMSPSSVNDSARAMMARAAEYRDDISGSLTTGGTATAYTLTTNQGLTAIPTDGQLIAFTMNLTNGVAPTMQVDGGTVYAIQTAPGVAVNAATLIAGTPYTAKFSLANTSWILRDFYGSAFSVPLGSFLDSTIATPPNANFILPAGQCISTTTYATYWVALGSPASGACPGGQFAVVDMRGRYSIALDNLNGTNASRMTASIFGCGTAMTTMGAVCANGAESATLTLAQLPLNIQSNNATQAISVSTALHIPSANANWAGTTTLSSSSTQIAFTAGSVGDIQTLGPTNNSISVTSNNTSGNPRPMTPPTIAVYKFLRVL